MCGSYTCPRCNSSDVLDMASCIPGALECSDCGFVASSSHFIFVPYEEEDFDDDDLDEYAFG